MTGRWYCYPLNVTIPMGFSCKARSEEFEMAPLSPVIVKGLKKLWQWRISIKAANDSSFSEMTRVDKCSAGTGHPDYSLFKPARGSGVQAI